MPEMSLSSKNRVELLMVIRKTAGIAVPAVIAQSELPDIDPEKACSAVCFTIQLSLACM